MRIAFDTNLLVAALVNPSGASASIVERWRRGELIFVASRATLREAEQVLGGGWVARVASGGARAQLVRDLFENTEQVDAPRIASLPPLKDAGDRRLVEAAVAGNAAYLVTSDREVLLRRGHDSVEFITPDQLISLLKKRRSGS